MTSLLQTFAQTGEPASGTVVGWGQHVMPYVPTGEPFRAAAIAAVWIHILAVVRDVAPPVELFLLEIARAENAVVPKWPATAEGYVLESTPTLRSSPAGVVVREEAGTARRAE